MAVRADDGGKNIFIGEAVCTRGAVQDCHVTIDHKLTTVGHSGACVCVCVCVCVCIVCV